MSKHLQITSKLFTQGYKIQTSKNTWKGTSSGNTLSSCPNLAKYRFKNMFPKNSSEVFYGDLVYKVIVKYAAKCVFSCSKIFNAFDFENKIQ